MKSNWSETVILADADYVDSVAFQLIVNFERMLGRRIPKADMAQWLVCAALDGGLRPTAECESGKLQTSAIFTYTKAVMANFTPGDLVSEVNGQAFMDEHLGEFSLSAYPVESMVDGSQFFIDVLDTICSQPEVKRFIVIPNVEQPGVVDMVRQCLCHHENLASKQSSSNVQVTLLAMQPLPGGSFRQEMLGYSLMAALGIRGEEVTQNLGGR